MCVPYWHSFWPLFPKLLCAPPGCDDVVPAPVEIRYDVILKDRGDQMISTIKAIRSVVGTSLKESKYLAEHLPQQILHPVSKERAESIKTDMQRQCGGCLVEIKISANRRRLQSTSDRRLLENYPWSSQHAYLVQSLEYQVLSRLEDCAGVTTQPPPRCFLRSLGSNPCMRFAGCQYGVCTPFPLEEDAQTSTDSKTYECGNGKQCSTESV